jgi:glutaconate CoA-transferase subunit A
VAATVEEVVESLPPAMNSIVLPHWVVSAVVHCPGGAYPAYAQGYYGRDNAFYQRWDAIARERGEFLSWMQRHVLGSRDHREFLSSLGAAA